MTLVNPHAETAQKALSLLKELSASLDGWDFSEEKAGVKLYRKADDTSPISIVRGETDLVGHEFTTQQVLSVATLPGCRKIWDEKFDTSEIKEMYSRGESLFWSKLKAPWPVYPRDIAGTSLREASDTECCVVMTSVEDESVPEVSGCVRAKLIVSGWRITKTDTGIHITYITQIDLAGYIPTSFLKGIEQQVPLCAGAVVNYIGEYGFAPTTLECTARFKTENFEHDTKEYSCNVDDVGDIKWVVSTKMYPNDINVSIIGSGGNAQSTVDLDDKKNRVVVVTGIKGPTTIKITSK
ncbi:hypothetical protein BD408DRAFT_446399 [Parasitella parasitica]|nr:hypothetical protein BD408DRAFT_446399 [Parasitella parasitica]